MKPGRELWLFSESPDMLLLAILRSLAIFVGVFSRFGTPLEMLEIQLELGRREGLPILPQVRWESLCLKVTIKSSLRMIIALLLLPASPPYSIF